MNQAIQVRNDTTTKYGFHDVWKKHAGAYDDVFLKKRHL